MADPLKQMCDELGVCTEEALFYLEGFRWDLNAAMEACRSKTLPAPSLTAQPPSSENERYAAEEQMRNEKIETSLEVSIGSSAEDAIKSKPVPLSHDGHTEPWYLHGFSGDTMEDVLSKVPQFHNTSTNIRIGSSPAASTPPLELKPESIKRFRDVVSDASSQAVIDCLNQCKGDVDAAINYFYDDYSKKNPTESLPDEIKEELIASFSSTTGATRQVAKVYLEKYNWVVNRAVNFFFEPTDSGKETSALMENRDPPLPSMGLPSQSQFESSYVSSGPTETQKSLEEAGEGDATVAIPGMASSQVDGKAVEEGSSKETVPDPFANRDRTTVETRAAASTIMITIRLADTTGTSLELPFRSNQTIRDIRNAIDQRYPDNDRGYFLQSVDGVTYMDWNITVYKVSRGGSTILFQTYP